MQVKLALYTLGCKANQYDTQLMREALAAAGYTLVRWGEGADVYLVNTCTVTARSDRKSRKAILEAHRLNGRAAIYVTGCYAAMKRDLLESLPGVRRAGGREDILELLGAVPKGGGGITYFADHARAFVKVQDGCSRFCSYCIVPRVRGRSRSRPVEEVVAEVSGLFDAGYREVVLSGVCLGDYTHEGKGLASLLAALEDASFPGRIRLSSLEPDAVSDELLAIMSSSRAFCRHLHIPFQSGDDGVLAAMKRPCSRESYYDLIRRVRRRMPDAGISADFIIGFPGETEEAFERSLDVVRGAEAVRVHIFPFSPREGTPAAGMGPVLPGDEAARRAGLLRAAASEASLAFRSRFLGSEMVVLCEEGGGYTSNYIRVGVEGDGGRVGELLPVTITEVTPTATHGVLASPAEHSAGS